MGDPWNVRLIPLLSTRGDVRHSPHGLRVVLLRHGVAMLKAHRLIWTIIGKQSNACRLHNGRHASPGSRLSVVVREPASSSQLSRGAGAKCFFQQKARMTPGQISNQSCAGVNVPNRPSCSLTRPVVKYRTCGLDFSPPPKTNVHKLPSGPDSSGTYCAFWEVTVDRAPR